MGVFVPPGKQTFTDPSTGFALAFGLVYHFIPGTDTPKDTWSDQAETTLNPNPIELDAAGDCIIWGDGLYRQVLQRADFTEVWDQVTGFDDGGGTGVTFASPAQVAALSDPTLVISPYALGASGVLGGGSGGGFYPKFTDLGGVGNGNTSNPATGTDNASAFTTAQSNSSTRIWLNDGVFRTSSNTTDTNKFYDGSGRIYQSATGEVLPGRFTSIQTPPTQFPTQGPGGWYAGDTKYIEGEQFIIGAACRHSITDRYFEATTIPHSQFFFAYGGSSGCIAHIASSASIGATSLVLNDVSQITIGNTLGVGSAFGIFTDQVLVSGVNSGTNTITFTTTPLSHAYVTGGYVGFSLRTNNPFYYFKGTNAAPGDFVGNLSRIAQSFQPYVGQTHFFETATISQYGGDINYTSGTGGTYSTVLESQQIDNGNDVAAIAYVQSFVRTNDTGARSVVWMGSFWKSEGTKPCDAGYVLAGAWRVGYDTVRADLSTFLTPGDNINAAINTALGHRWVMNSTATLAGRGGSTVYGTFYGNTPGDMYIESGTDGTGDYIAARFNRSGGSDGRWRLRPNSFSVNVPCSFQSTISVTGAAAFGAGLAVTTDIVLGAGNEVAFGLGSGNFHSFNVGLARHEFYVGGVLAGHIP